MFSTFVPMRELPTWPSPPRNENPARSSRSFWTGGSVLPYHRFLAQRIPPEVRRAQPADEPTGRARLSARRAERHARRLDLNGQANPPRQIPNRRLGVNSITRMRFSPQIVRSRSSRVSKISRGLSRCSRPRQRLLSRSANVIEISANPVPARSSFQKVLDDHGESDFAGPRRIRSG